jgi:protein involved in polysaccharide export with SLBB domain
VSDLFSELRAMKKLLFALLGLLGIGVITVQAGTESIIVGGAVRDAGHVPFATGMTLTQAIRKAGAASDWTRAKLVRDGKANSFSRKSISKNPLTDPKLRRGDYIEVEGEF